MTHYVLPHLLPGYPDCNTIQTQYDKPAGIQTQFHPNPRVPYSSLTRIAYLPNNSKGQMVSNLLQLAFERGFILTVGRSFTSSLDSMVIWSDIHHKTEVSGSVFGYPDVNYLDQE